MVKSRRDGISIYIYKFIHTHGISIHTHDIYALCIHMVYIQALTRKERGGWVDASPVLHEQSHVLLGHERSVTVEVSR